MRSKTTQEETLTDSQFFHLQEAIKLITIEDLEDLDYGESLHLNDYFCLYHYSTDDLIVLNLIEDWEEIYCVLWDNEGIITFDAL